MDSHFVGDCISLVVYALVSWVIWFSYRGQVFGRSLKFRTLWPRYWSGWVDATLLAALTLPIGVLFEFNVPNEWVACVTIAYTLVWPLYSILMHAHFGQTVGKMVTGVRVVDARTEGPITFLQAVFRDGIALLISGGVLYFQVIEILQGRADRYGVPTGGFSPAVTIVPIFWFALEIITGLSNVKRRAVHDFIAGTVVVRTSLSGSSNLVQGSAVEITNP